MIPLSAAAFSLPALPLVLPGQVGSLPQAHPLPTGFDAFIHGLVGRVRRMPHQLRAIQGQATGIAGDIDLLSDLSDAALKTQLHAQREAVRCSPDGGDTLGPALAVLAEAARRSLGLRPFPVQLAGSIALYRGFLVEMATGEGKTLTAGLAAALSAWNGKPCHVVTANDYLASRDAEIMAPFFAFCGISVAAVTADMPPEQRCMSYASDIVYVTAKELLGDFLRDRLMTRNGPDTQRRMLHRWLGKGVGAAADRASDRLLVRGLHTAIIDEADSILIDEAVTPLILSAPRESQGTSEAVLLVCELARTLEQGLDYRVETKQKSIDLQSSARQRLAELADRLAPLWRAPARREELLRQALMARAFFKRDQSYVIQDGKIVLLDEYTGRMTPNRTLSAGLHQAIEAHEGLEISNTSETLAQMSFQAFFRQFYRLSGMTGTGRESVSEFWQIYGLAGLAVPTNRPCIRRVKHPVVFATEEEKWRGIVAEIEVLHARGQPILVGTRSVHASEALAERLLARGLVFELLNAVRHQDESRIIAGAGAIGRITIATNMAGRGTDIKLGSGAADLGGLHVIITEIHDSGRIDRQLLGRSGRQGDPGSVSIFLSLEDELACRFLPVTILKLFKFLPHWHIRGSERLTHLAFRLAQLHAERQAFYRRRSVLQTDRWLESALPFGKRM